MIVGLVPADAGSIVLDGTPTSPTDNRTRAKRGVGYLPQEPSVFRKLSVADNIRLVLELREDLDDDGRERELEGLLDELQIGHVAEQLGASLSGGERRRVEIARTRGQAAHDPARRTRCRRRPDLGQRDPAHRPTSATAGSAC